MSSPRTLLVPLCLTSLCIGCAATGASGPGSAPAPASQPRVRESTITATGRYPIESSLILWQPGSMAWPNLRGAPDKYPPTTTSTLKTVEISNDWLTARFIPEIGFRLYDLTWNDDPLRRQSFRRIDEIEYHHIYRWEGPGYFLFFGSMKWGFPYYGHTISDHMPWTVTHGLDAGGNAWAEGAYTDPDTGIIGTVRAVLPRDAARVDFTFTCRNPRAEAQGFDYWIDSHVPASRHTEFAMAATEGITHQKSWGLLRQMFFPWPRLGGRDLRFLREWDASQGVFPADLQAGYSGFYNHARRTGVMRVFPPKVADGVKYWMPGIEWGPDPVGEMFGGSEITQDERRYLAPGQTLAWNETWYPVRDLEGIDGGNRDVALRLATSEKGAALHLTATRHIDSARVVVETQPQGAAPAEICRTTVSLSPGRATTVSLPAIDTSKPGRLQVSIRTGRGSFVWHEDLGLLKPVYTDEKLDKDRQAYTDRLREQNEAPAKAHAEPPPPPERFAFRHAGNLAADHSRLLGLPNACCVLPDGSIAIADRNTIRLHGPDLSFRRNLGLEGLRWPLGLCAAGTTLYVADTSNCRILCVDLPGEKVVRTIDLPSQPAGIALWQDRLAVALPRAGQVVQLDLSQESPEPILLAGPKDLRHPFGLAADGDRLLVADPAGQRVLAISAGGKTRVLAGRSQGLEMPSRIAVLAGQVYVADAQRCQLLRLDSAGGSAAVHLNGRLFGAISMSLPGDVATAGDELLVATAYPATLARISAGGDVAARYDIRENIWPDNRPTFQSFCRRPNGDWLAADSNFHVLWYDRDGKLKNLYGAWGRSDSQFWEPGPLACDSRGYVYVGDFFNFRVLRYDPQLQQLPNLGMDHIQTDGVPATDRWYVRGLATDAAGRLAVAVCGGQGIYLYSPAPQNKLLLILRPYDRFRPMGVAFDKKNNLYAIDDEAGKVLIYPAEGLARCLESGRPGRTLATADLSPAAWSFQPNAGATCIVPDERGGCYVSLAGQLQKVEDVKSGTIAHFGPDGRIDRTIVSRWSAMTCGMALDGDELIVTNISRGSATGINAIQLDRPAATAPATQPQGRQVFATAWSDVPDLPGDFRDLTGLHPAAGQHGSCWQVLDMPRGRVVTIDPAAMKILAEEPTSLFGMWHSVNADGSVNLHAWPRSTSIHWQLDGRTRNIEFKDVAHPGMTARDNDGCWWVTDEVKHTLALFDAKGPDGAEPLWKLHCGDRNDPIADTWSIAWLPDGNAWIIERERQRLSLLSRKDGRVLASTPPGVVLAPDAVGLMPDGSLLVSDRRWGILQVSPDGQRSWRIVQGLPPRDRMDIYYGGRDAKTGRLLYACSEGGTLSIGYADPISPGS